MSLTPQDHNIDDRISLKGRDDQDESDSNRYPTPLKIDNTAPTVSAELFLIPYESDKYIIYAPLRRAAFIANSVTVNALADLQAGIWDHSCDPEGLLIQLLNHLKIINAEMETPPTSRFFGNPKPIAVTLFLTTACNLRCTYCYASAGDTPLRSMSLEVAQRGIDFVLKNAQEQGQGFIDINYHGGGEPSANWQVLTLSLQYARQKANVAGVKVRAFSATNGVLNNVKINWIIKNLDGCVVSFDGLPEMHDANRLTVLGEGSSDRILHTLRQFDNSNFRYGIRMTVTANQIATLPDSVEFVLKNFRPQRIHIEPAFQLGRWRTKPSIEVNAFVSAFREADERAMAYGHELFFSGARLGILTNHFCGITQDSFALSPDGNVSACYEVFSEDDKLSNVFFYGSYDKHIEGYHFNLPVLNNLRNQSVENREFCQGCFAKWSCAGDCYHRSISVNGQGEFSGSDRCHITRELTKDQIIKKLINSEGIYWYDSISDEKLFENTPTAEFVQST